MWLHIYGRTTTANKTNMQWLFHFFSFFYIGLRTNCNYIMFQLCNVTYFVNMCPFLNSQHAVHSKQFIQGELWTGNAVAKPQMYTHDLRFQVFFWKWCQHLRDIWNGISHGRNIYCCWEYQFSKVFEGWQRQFTLLIKSLHEFSTLNDSKIMLTLFLVYGGVCVCVCALLTVCVKRPFNSLRSLNVLGRKDWSIMWLSVRSLCVALALKEIHTSKLKIYRRTKVIHWLCTASSRQLLTPCQDVLALIYANQWKITILCHAVRLKENETHPASSKVVIGTKEKYVTVTWVIKQCPFCTNTH